VDSVLLPGSWVRAGATVTCSVLDDGVEIGESATVGGEGEIALVGSRASVEAGAHLAAGARYPESQDD
jgi:glucose-1-phosphate adenylyltransferase